MSLHLHNFARIALSFMLLVFLSLDGIASTQVTTSREHESVETRAQRSDLVCTYLAVGTQILGFRHSAAQGLPKAASFAVEVVPARWRAKWNITKLDKIAVNPTGRLLLVAYDNRFVAVYRVGTRGELSGPLSVQNVHTVGGFVFCPWAPSIVYVPMADNDAGDLKTYRLLPNGRLHRLPWPVATTSELGTGYHGIFRLEFARDRRCVFAAVLSSGCGPHYTSIVSYKVDPNGRLAAGSYIWHERGDASYAVSPDNKQLYVSSQNSLQSYTIQPNNLVPKKANSEFWFSDGTDMPMDAPIALFDGGNMLVRVRGASLTVIPIERDGKLGYRRHFLLSTDGSVTEEFEPPPAEFAAPASPDTPAEQPKSHANLAYIRDVRKGWDGRLNVLTDKALYVFDTLNPDTWLKTKAKRLPHAATDLAALQLRPLRRILPTR